MAKCCDRPLTEAEWAEIPFTFDASTMARVLCANPRYVQNHAAELGGIKTAGKWLFSKPRTAQLLGLAG